MFKLTLFIGLLLISPTDCKFKIFGGSKSSNSNSFRPQQNHGFAPQQNHGFQPHPQAPAPGWHPNVQQPNANRFGQPNQPHMNPGGFAGNRNFPGAHGGTSNFKPGGGLGSPSRGSAFKSALAGAALGTIGGLAAYELGKAIISNAHSPFHYGNREYYWGPEYYNKKHGEIMCSMPLDQLISQSQPTTTTTTVTPDVTQEPNSTTTTPSPNEVLNSLQFKDGTRPKQVVWGCKAGQEVCCGTECCPAPVQNQASPNSGSTGSNVALIVLGILLVIAILACCCCFVAYKLCRNAFDSCLPASNQPEQQYYDDGHNKYGDNQQPYGQSYPMQPYPNQTYNNGPYPDSAPAYPSGPHAPYPSNAAPYPDQPHYGPPKY